ncbi:MAG: hypothetical protein GX275_11970 [Clostridiales bacterium]|jgi:hypothetical protein|nr:hypothetical protein [Clostridiales bacterium]
MRNIDEINNIKNTLLSPNTIYATKDKYGNIAKIFIKGIDNDMEGGKMLWENK